MRDRLQATSTRRWFNIVPFVHKPPTPDRTLEQKLRAKWPGILRWMIDGCPAWQQSGLMPPKVVLDATAEYFSEQDSVQQWIEERCDTGGPNLFETTATLFKSWSEYAQANGEKPGATKWFTPALMRQGCEPVKNTPGQRGKRGFRRIQVKPLDTSGQWQNRDRI